MVRYSGNSRWMVKVSTIWMAIICFLLILPDDVFSAFSLYFSGTPDSIAYKWLNYNFGIIQLLVLILGIWLSIKRKNQLIWLTVLYFFLREIFCVVFGGNSIFKASAYEMYLALFVGISFVLWSLDSMQTTKNMHTLYEAFLYLNIATVYLMTAMGGHGGWLTGRYNASNLDVGTTGVLCCVGLFFMYFKKDFRYRSTFIVLTFIALFLSGSRTNFALAILFTIAILMVQWWENLRTEKRGMKKRAFMAVLFLIFAAVFLIVLKSDQIIAAINNSRYVALFTSSGISSDSSILGRTKSIQAGLDILKTYPLGISGYFVNLQTEVRARGFETFPHCGILSAYLIYGPVVLALYGAWIWMAVKLFRKSKTYAWTLIFFIIYNLIAGSPITNFKIIFIYGMPTVLAWRTLQETNKLCFDKKETRSREEDKICQQREAAR